jgi:hypothetical protein
LVVRALIWVHVKVVVLRISVGVRHLQPARLKVALCGSAQGSAQPGRNPVANHGAKAPLAFAAQEGRGHRLRPALPQAL